MTDDLEALMQEPPGGENHGRVRTSGGWRSLEHDYSRELPYVIADPDARPRQTGSRHGTVARYNRGCHCAACRWAIREYRRRRRQSG